LPTYITAAAGIKAFYFKDFDNHVLEILQFPAGKGSQKWHEMKKAGKLFLGIDHTAIVVDDTDASLNYYRDKLGLAVAGSSDNYGNEQEHLNNVFAARLHITGLRTTDEGIAVEFLEYKSPTDGRPYPMDSRSNDLWHWQTSFAVQGLAQLLDGFRAEYISSGSVSSDQGQLGFRNAALIRDPDGHAVRLVER
jgi:catechol 2,3-dioxygenase-like lactoylglutathione lyase family enzyme